MKWVEQGSKCRLKAKFHFLVNIANENPLSIYFFRSSWPAQCIQFHRALNTLPSSGDIERALMELQCRGKGDEYLCSMSVIPQPKKHVVSSPFIEFQKEWRREL